MILAGNTALFRLTEAGRQELQGYVAEKGVLDDSLFEGFVVETDTFGAFVISENSRDVRSSGAFPVVLVKWEYVASVLVDWKPAATASRAKIGFGR